MFSSGLFSARWALKRLEVVNWGGYDGYHVFEPSLAQDGKITLLTGESESGKSTLLDAHTSLLYPAGTKYNKASNQGKSDRSDFTYLRGQCGFREDYGKSVPEYLRGRDGNGLACPVWGAIAELYESDMGELVSIAKFMYLAAGDGSDRVRKHFLISQDLIDVRLMDAYRDESFTPGLLKQVYGSASVFSSAESFHESAWGIFGLTKDACRLLHRMQASDAPSKLDDIFKQGVLAEPRALAYARNAVDDYERYKTNFTEMRRNNERKELLEEVEETYGQYAGALDTLRELAPIDPETERGAQLIEQGTLALVRDDLLAGLPKCVGEKEALESQMRETSGRRRVVQDQLDEVKRSLDGTAGGNLAVLEAQLENSEKTLERVKSDNERLAGRFEAAGRKMPTGPRAFQKSRDWAAEFARGYKERKSEISRQRIDAALAAREAEDACQKARDDFERASKRRTRITEDMEADRGRLARATGLDESELPYVAELVDVEDESWRLAMNVVYGGIARTILVDKKHERGFAAKVSAIDPQRMRRRNWEFVDTTAEFSDDSEEGWMSGKVVYREGTPFEAWLRNRLSSERNDAKCVEKIDDDERNLRQVQRDGQVKDKRRGAHGAKGIKPIIGFVTEQYLDELRDRIVRANEAWSAAKGEQERLEKELALLEAEYQLAEALEGLEWGRVDVNAATEARDELVRTIDEIRNNPQISELIAQKEALEARVEKLAEELYLAKARVAEMSDAIESARSWLGLAETGIGAVDLPDVCSERLEEAYADAFPSSSGPAERLRRIVENQGKPDGLLSFPRVKTTVNRVARSIGDDVERRRAAVGSKQEVCEAKMQQYLGLYAPDDEDVGTSVDDISWYRDLLEQVRMVAPGKSTRAEYEHALDAMAKTFMQIKSSDSDDCKFIRSQTQSINALLATFPFGAKQGRLSLEADIRRPTPEFRNALNRTIDRLNEYAEREEGDRSAKKALRAFNSCEPLVRRMEEDLALLRKNRAYELDPRNRTHFTARVDNGGGDVEVVSSTGSGSGGYVQELVSFVYGAALIYLLGDGQSGAPSFATVFMDEALIKADAQYTQRVLSVLPGLGFQVIVAAPLSKTSEMMECADVVYVARRDRETNKVELQDARLVESEPQADGGVGAR